MKCAICDYAIRFFHILVSCPKNHSYHKDCLTSCIKDMTLYQMISSCEDCILRLLPNLASSDYCIKCKCFLQDEDKRCNDFKHFCRNCDIEYIPHQHYVTCGSCKSKHFQFQLECCTNCSHLSKKDKMIICHPNHYICSRCIFSRNWTSSCNQCILFMQERRFLASLKCCSCSSINIDESVSCKFGHYYCSSCIENFNLKDDCDLCKEFTKIFIEDSNARNIMNRSIIKKRNIVTPREKIEPLKQKDIPSQAIINSKLEEPIIEDMRKVFPKNLMCDACHKSIFNLSKVPSCTVHYYCPECIGKTNQTACPDCCDYFDHQILPLIEIPLCQKSFDHPSDIAFACCHNLCFRCISQEYEKLLKYFLDCIENKKYKKIKSKFAVKCLAINCHQSLSIPFERIKRFVNLNLFTQKEHLILVMFIPYFDGIKFSFYYCKCRNIVGQLGNLNLNCIC